MIYDVKVADMKLGIAHLQEETHDRRNPKTLAVIYAEAETHEKQMAIIDLITQAVDLLNERLAEIRKSIDPKPDPELTNLAWYYRELEAGRADRITLRDHD